MLQADKYQLKTKTGMIKEMQVNSSGTLKSLVFKTPVG
jgi:hypothetical protein